MESILIIDDEAQIRSMIRLILEREGYVVMEAPDGTEGIRQFREKPTDLIITDIIMPNKDGIGMIIERDHHGMAICPLNIHEDACMRDWLLPESAASLKLHSNCDLIPRGC